MGKAKGFRLTEANQDSFQARWASVRARVSVEAVPLATRLGWDACWVWQGAKTSDGYGHASWLGVMWGCHRLAVLERQRYLSAGHVVMHLCQTRSCCNPAHLKEGSYMDNLLDAAQVARLRTRWLRLRRAPLGLSLTLTAGSDHGHQDEIADCQTRCPPGLR